MRVKIRSLARTLTSAACLLCWTTAIRGQQASSFRADDIVLMKTLDVELSADGRRLRTDDAFAGYKVVRVDAEQLFVMGEAYYPAGWVKRADVVAVDQAVDYFTSVVNLEPPSARAHFLRGTARLFFLKFDEALEDFHEALRIDPSYALAHVGLARVKVGRGDFSGGEGELNEAIRLAPRSALAFAYRGEARSATSDWENGLRDYTSAISIQPENGFLYCKRRLFELNCPMSSGLWTTSRSGFRSRRGPTGHMPHGGPCATISASTSWRVADMDEAIRLNPSSEDALVKRAYVRMHLGNMEGAVNDTIAAAKISPRSALAYFARGVIWSYFAQHDRAVQDFNEALALDQSHWYAFWRRGNCEFMLGKLDLAISDYTEALRRDPDDVAILCLRHEPFAKKVMFRAQGPI